MASISGSTSEKVFTIKAWGGLNEHPDGDTGLKMGEAAQMSNWRITPDGNLKRRPGYGVIFGLCQSYEIVYSQATFDFTTLPDYEKAIYESATVVNGKITLGTKIGDYTAEQAAAYLENHSEFYCWNDDRYYKVTQVLVGDAICVWTGYKMIPSDASEFIHPIAGMWSGYVAGKEVFLAACQGRLYNIYNSLTDAFAVTYIGTLYTDKNVDFIPWDNKVYILDGHEYYCWDGTTFGTVDGYRPLVAVSIGPIVAGESGTASAGELTTEYINRLNGKRRVWISPDGENGTFQLPEKGVTTPSPTMSIDYVKNLATGTEVPSSAYTLDVDDGTVAFSPVLAKGVNTYEIAYSMTTTFRSQVTGNLFHELYSGSTDTRIILYGDGTNRALYSGMDYDGQPRADYFPDQYEVRVGDSNTPITAMVRHYGDLVAYKTNEAWGITYGVIDLATDALTPAYYCVPVNKTVGNTAMGQVCLVNNNPVTAYGNHLYQWVNSSYYTSGLSRDERQASVITDRVQGTLSDFYLPASTMYDDNEHQEFYVANGTSDKCLVWNYANNTWYCYDGIDAIKFWSFHGELYFGTSDGFIMKLSDDYAGDDGEPIEARWISGSMDFGAAYTRKYSRALWVGLKPEEGTSVWVDIMTDRKENFREKLVPSDKAKIDYQPFVVKTKIKAKKFEYYRLGFFVSEKQPPVTVTEVSIRVRATGDAK